MSLTGLLVFLAIGATAGWLGGLIMKGSGFGLLGNIIVGIIGAVLGGFLFAALGISTSGLLGSIVTATAGAVVLLFIASLVRRA
ncbi:MAG: GlsB/YeaQ/YmgE family stress response membrane protein [Gammaproteobacteria bacterium]|nr:GlsB/YeaQ/YmgE family stress response membrane protein [Gammaproteobacteria bacterium]MBU2058290.1 GlsB/YeaQ/YmgE family stress response membrane protein [Gammaproteobacteria bacterium]MBU2176657.1 GlsB/YeaQ/YmgE family stress response membrane protein [Gammaproteobacteria bacterium]MBU2248401.1 GlsB/YeaQ/YmgE family stress response membrane protein [Gammaproteobacteria bacterium]MBU2345736.1 GlsB/YeaQ/YmgE family stress response membrane protein [Gammaproteobacteria bacterium]